MSKLKYLNTIFCFILITGFSGCSINREPAPDTNSDFNIIVLSDTHVSSDESKDERFREMVRKINNKEFGNTKFVAITGDFVSSIYVAGKERNAENSRLVKGYSIFSKLNVPLYIALGNHDYKIDNDRDSDAPFNENEIQEMEEIWKKDAKNQQPYFSVSEEGWKFIFLNSMRGRFLKKNFDPTQLKWFEKELNEDKPVILFFHHPVQTDNFRFWAGKDVSTPGNEPELYRIINDNKNEIKGIFVGHGHRWENDILFEMIPVYETASFGDEEGLPFNLIRFYNEKEKIGVEQFHLQTEEEKN